MFTDGVTEKSSGALVRVLMLKGAVWGRDDEDIELHKLQKLGCD